MSKKLGLLITLVVLLVVATGCERPGITEMAVPDSWLRQRLWPSAVAAPAAEGWVEPGWLQPTLLTQRLLDILISLLLLVAVAAVFFFADAWLRRRLWEAKKPRR